MSLILEALRRSEAERRRGEAPDVLAPVEVARPVSPPGMPARARWGTAALAVMVVAGAAWWQLAPTGAKAPAPVSGDDTVAVAAPAPVPTPAPAPYTQTAARTATSAAPSSTVDAAVAPSPPPAPTLPAVPLPVAPLTTPAASAEPDAIASAPPTRSAPLADSPAPAPATVPAHATEFISPEATVRLAELTSEERKQLPALKISMHMWAPDPANRFVIIDGARLEEGDRVADATVSSILADGVTLAWRGRQIRLPIR